MFEDKHQRLFDEAIKMWASGHDNDYIELQFIEKGVDRELINRILKEITKTEKSVDRRQGVKLIIGGLATVGVAVVFTLVSYNSDSPVRYILFGLIATGVITFASGVIKLI